MKNILLIILFCLHIIANSFSMTTTFDGATINLVIIGDATSSWRIGNLYHIENLILDITIIFSNTTTNLIFKIPPFETTASGNATQVKNKILKELQNILLPKLKNYIRGVLLLTLSKET